MMSRLLSLVTLLPSARHGAQAYSRHQQLLAAVTRPLTTNTATASTTTTTAAALAWPTEANISPRHPRGSRARRTLATVAADASSSGGPDTDDVTEKSADDASSSSARRFLIGNSGNDVQRLQCTSPQILRQGLFETSALPHVCVAGESNAGKSSLINHLLAKKGLAKASSVAGKTRSVDMMLVNEQVVVTDLPGLPSRDHQVSGMWETAWRPLVLDYLRRCEGLRCMLYVHDVRWKVSGLVRDFLDEVRDECGVPVLLVLSKDDRLGAELERKRPAGQGGARDDAEAAAERVARLRGEEIAQRERYLARIRRGLDFDGVHLHYSVDSDKAASRKARRRLLRYIESMAAAGSREECRQMLDDIAATRRRD